MALVGQNVFAFLNDDVEDAGDGSVNKEALVPKKAVPHVPTTSSSTAKDTPAQKRSGGGQRGSGPRGKPRNSGPGGEGEVGPPVKGGREQRSARHSDRRDHPSNTMNARSNNWRAQDRKSGTGRGREVAKRGGGGKFVYGSDRQDARSAEQSANAALSSGAGEDSAVSAAEQATKGGAETEIEEGKEQIAPDQTDGAAADDGDKEAGEEEENEKNISIEEYEKQKAETKANLGEILSAGKSRRVANDGEAFSAMTPLKKDDELEDMFAPQSKGKGKGKKLDAKKAAKDATAEFFSGGGNQRQAIGPRRPGNDRSQRTEREGSGRRPGGRSRHAGEAPKMDDVSAFPSLGAGVSSES